MFFDGTGNNRDVDLPEHKHSNVVRLFRVHKDNSRDFTIAPPVSWQCEYVPGVGTAFPEIGELGNSARQLITGKALANGGQSRIFWGLIQTINAMHRYVKGGEPLMSDAEAGEFAQDTGDGSADSALDELKARVSILKGILSKSKPTVTQFNISVFGF